VAVPRKLAGNTESSVIWTVRRSEPQISHARDTRRRTTARNRAGGGERKRTALVENVTCWTQVGGKYMSMARIPTSLHSISRSLLRGESSIGFRPRALGVACLAEGGGGVCNVREPWTRSTSGIIYRALLSPQPRARGTGPCDLWSAAASLVPATLSSWLGPTYKDIRCFSYLKMKMLSSKKSKFIVLLSRCTCICVLDWLIMVCKCLFL
jgi:hypothetical protein